MRIIGVDFGEKRTGLAVSDPFGWTAQGVETVSGEMDVAVSRIVALAEQYSAETVVVGYPLNMNGTAGPRVERTEEFIAVLSKRLSCPVEKWDERLTSVYASNTLKETGVKASRNKAKVDLLSAVLLLQSYLDNKSGKQ